MTDSPIPDSPITEPPSEPGASPAPRPSAAGEPPTISPAERARITRQAVLGLTIPAAVTTGAAAALWLSGHRPTGLGVAIGGAAGIVITATWLAGAVVSFDRPGVTALGLTMGLWPIRLALLFFAAGSGAIFGAEPIAMALALFATFVAGHVVEALVLDALARAVRPPPPESNS